jgi:flagellar L-ring protein precursor FlgH
MKKLITLIVFLLSFSFAYSDSIWNDASSSPYSVSKSFRVGDVITVMILESTSAVQKAGTNTNANDSLGLSFNSNIAGFYHPGRSVSGSGGNTYQGLGDTSRTSNVTAKVASVVVKVLPNRNLVIEGEHRVEVNGEVQTVKISGVIRPKDVSLQNTVYSYQVADASVSVKGSGTVGDVESPGVFTRILNWIF